MVASALLLVACGEPKKEEPKKAAAPAKPPDQYRVKFDTTKGEFTIEVKREWSPRGADHFFDLVQSRFYNGVRFHRTIRGFIAQFGINGDPKVNQIWSMAQIPDDPAKLKNKRGTIAYAKLGPNSRTTQVFINLRDSSDLDTTGFAPFGKVVDGMDVVDKLAYLYGELKPRGHGPDPGKIQIEGNKYLDREYPRLDSIKAATVVGE